MPMLGRGLFVLVCLVIGAGLALPLYPSRVGGPAVGASDDGLLLANAPAGGCEDCQHPVNAGADCRVGDQTARTRVRLPRACLNLTVYLVVHPALPGTPTSALGLLPLRLPNI